MTRSTYYTPDRLLSERVQIDLIGAGGNGSAMLDSLASMASTLTALGHPGFDVRVFDADTVSRTNLGRQRFTAADVGRAKASVLVHRVNLFYGLAWQAVPDCYCPGEHSGRAGLLISCVDSAPMRVALADKAISPFQGPGLWLDLGNEADHGQVVLGELAARGPRGGYGSEAGRLPHVVDLFPELRQVGDDDDGPSCSVEAAIQRQAWPVNRMAATHAANLLWSLFRYGRTDWHGVTFALDPPSVAPIHVDPVEWAMHGYTSEAAAA